MNTGGRKGLIFAVVVVAAIAAVLAVFDWGEQGPMGVFGDLSKPPSPPVSTPKSDKAQRPEPVAPAAPGTSPSAQPSTGPQADAAPQQPSGPQASAPQAALPGAATEVPSHAEPRKPENPADKGAFDVVRVEPSGDSVIAGRCSPGCSVELLANGKTHDRVVADSEGSWTMVPPQLAPGDYELGLRVRTPDGQVWTSDQTLTVSVPKPPSKDVVVVLNAPGAPSKVLAMPKPAAPAPDASANRPAQALSVGAVDAEGGRFFVQGAAPAGAMLRIYLNGSLIAAPVADPNGAWSLRVERGLSPGDYDLRVDQVENEGGTVRSRAEAKFSYRPEVAAATSPTNPAQAPSGAGATSSQAPGTQAGTASEEAASAVGSSGGGTAASTGAGDSANPVVASLSSVTVKRGDSLWNISRRSYGVGQRYTVIFAANDGQIRNPNLIYPGQVFVLPTKP